MRLLSATTLAATIVLALAVPASTAEVNPKLLVLQQADVPPGFALDRDDSGLRSNEREAKGDGRLRDLIRRWERTTGYEAEYDRRESSISSRADVFRTSEGANLLLAFIDREMQKSGAPGMRRSPVGVGARGWLYGAKPVSSSFNLVIWRHDRVFAGVAVFGLPHPKVLALARAQQRRIAAALG
jgi:hypothetical protein